MIGHDESVRAINRVMSVCLSLASLKLSDFHQRIKALHFHQICMSPEGNTANIGIICHIVRGIVIIFTQLRRYRFSVRPDNLYSKCRILRKVNYLFVEKSLLYLWIR